MRPSLVRGGLALALGAAGTLAAALGPGSRLSAGIRASEDLSLDAPSAAALAAPPAPLPLAATAPSAEPVTSADRDPSLRVLRAGTRLRGPAPFALSMDGIPVSLPVSAFTVLPGGSVTLASGPGLSLRFQDGSATPAQGGWRWTAPTVPGIYAVEAMSGGSSVHLTALVMVPAGEVRAEKLNGYAIGRYQAKALRGDPSYLPPRGFVEVRQADQDVLVSPRLTLGQFLCKQPGEPRYVAFSGPLVIKLEAVADLLEQRGIDGGSLAVMSGYRTPAYNLAIGNTTIYSRHLWGDAADIYVDADRNGDMDDLDGNGRIDTEDARTLYGWIEGAVASRREVVPGGMSVYRRNSAHGPFVHVDARGTRTRW